MPASEIDDSTFPSLYDNLPVPLNVPTHIRPEDLLTSGEDDGNPIAPSLAAGPSQESDPQGINARQREEVTPPVVETLDTSHLENAIQRFLDRNPGPVLLGQFIECLDNAKNVAVHRISAHEGENPETSHTAAVNGTKPTYSCPKCGMNTKNRAVFKRHTDNMYFPEYRYFCYYEGCPYENFRRDKVATHIKSKHVEMPDMDIVDRIKVSLPCPTLCICTRMVRTWAEFWDCYLDDCSDQPRPSHIPGNNKGGDERQEDGSQSTFGQGNPVSGNVAGQRQPDSVHAINPQQLINAPTGVLPRRTSAQPIRITRPGASISRPSQTNTHHNRPQNHHRTPIRTQRNNLRGRNPRRPRRDSAAHRHHGPASSPHQSQCGSCQHVFDSCCAGIRPSQNGCHRCVGAPPIIQTNQNPTGGYDLDTPPASQAVQYDPAYLDSEAHLGQALFDGIIPMTGPSDSDGWDGIHYQQQGGHAQRGRAQQMNSHRVLALPEVVVRGISESEMESDISVLDLKARSQAKKADKIEPALVGLPFRIPVPRPRRALTGAATMPSGGKQTSLTYSSTGIITSWRNITPDLLTPTDMELVTRQAFGPPSMSKVDLSSGCQCSCRTKSQGTYFGRGRVDIAPGRKVEMNFRMIPEERAAGHPLRTRIQVVVKMLRLRTSTAKSASHKHKEEAHAALKEALESTLEGSETTTKEGAKIVDLDDSADDSDVESIADSTFSACSRSSSYSDLALLSPSRPSSPAFACPRRSSCADLSVPSLWSSPLAQCDWEEDTPSSEDEPARDVELFEEEENELEFRFDLDLEASLNKLSRWTGVPTDDLCSDISVWDPERVFQYLMKYLLFVIFSLARSRDHDPNPCWDKRPPSQF